MSEWKLEPLSAVASVFNGKTPSKAEQRSTGHPVLKIRNVDELGEFRGPFESFVDMELAEKHGEKKVRHGDTLILNAAHNADYVASKTFRAKLPTFDSLATGEWLIVRPNTAKLDGGFVYYWVNHASTRRSLRELVNGIHLYPKDVARLTIPLPPLAEQRRIAAILDQAEALRAKRRHALAQLDTLTQSLFLSLFGDPATNAKRWSTAFLSDLLAIPLRNGLSPSNSGGVKAKVLTLSAITGDAFRADAWKEAPFQSVPPSDQRVDAADLLICRGNGNIRLVGKGYFPPCNMPELTFPDTMIAARISSDCVAPGFLQVLWNGSSVRRQIESLARTTNGTFKVNQTMLESIRLIAPPLHLQREFAAQVSAVERLKVSQRASLAKLDALFASLQHRAFRGEL